MYGYLHREGLPVTLGLDLHLMHSEYEFSQPLFRAKSYLCYTSVCVCAARTQSQTESTHVICTFIFESIFFLSNQVQSD